MSILRRVFVVRHGDSGAVAFESINDGVDSIHVEEQQFPADPREGSPLRHVVRLGLFTDEELGEIMDAITTYLEVWKKEGGRD